ncbi:uncharacterized protein LOC124144848 [Haliotis rufescens]|uniref:uncharacterized protein LOC124144848 n=1 Tax=Haliotis rufescens TaxID=6454 RepID=UPI001EB06EC4|nr:uncharacterized protein LOC124144848 [Haliotis rufescens]
MKNLLLHGLPIILVLIHLGSAARGGRFSGSRSGSYRRTYYSSGTYYRSGGGWGGGGVSSDTLRYVYIAIMGAIVIGLSIFICCVCYSNAKQRREIAKRDGGKTSKKVDQKRSRNVVGTTDC